MQLLCLALASSRALYISWPCCGLLVADCFERYPSWHYMDCHQPGDSTHHPQGVASVEASSLHNMQSLPSLGVRSIQHCPETDKVVFSS